MHRTLDINEVFGPTIQGEGPSLGTPCYFIRLFQCNLQCTWCDTPYTWAVTPQKAQKHREGIQYARDEQSRTTTVDALALDLCSRQPWSRNHRNPMIVISGGEPLLQQEGVVELIMHPLMQEAHTTWEIETAGTIVPTPTLQGLVESHHVRFNVSPKLATSGNALRARRHVTALKEFADFWSTAFKFVITTDEDLDEVDEIVRLVDIPAERVFIMPEGMTAERVLAGMQFWVDRVVERGYNLTTRLHTLIWGNERGR
jgi:7-carboxy-7-deazaguanine synthase